ncbi:hypothetical protein TREES_T100015114 [Tupaia chinensis]|uniref:Uncharacterized protein n=1 Tax=Tupaia chinensis TaxID=246437 RepID=L9KFZ6_TUPCH|nr:hypothetical protein TREES_T100015114 [Tupaia chinensis]
MAVVGSTVTPLLQIDLTAPLPKQASSSVTPPDLHFKITGVYLYCHSAERSPTFFLPYASENLDEQKDGELGVPANPQFTPGGLSPGMREHLSVDLQALLSECSQLLNGEDMELLTDRSSWDLRVCLRAPCNVPPTTRVTRNSLQPVCARTLMQSFLLVAAISHKSQQRSDPGRKALTLPSAADAQACFGNTGSYLGTEHFASTNLWSGFPLHA